jgi:DNA-binding NarL/FixJ family response regulator
VADDAMSLDKIASVLGMLLTKDMSNTERIGTLSACGFSVKDIARLTGSTENAVHARLSDFRKRAASG